MVKNTKVELSKCLDKDKLELIKDLKQLQKECCLAANRAINEYYLWEIEKINYFKQNGKYPDEKEMFGQSYQNYIYHKIQEQLPTFNSSNVSTLNQWVKKNWGHKKKEVIKYKCSLPTFKSDIPIPIYNNNYSIEKYDENRYVITISIYNKLCENRRFKFITSKVDNYLKAILDRLISGEYKQSASQIIINKNKIFLNIGYSFESKNENILQEKALGIDLGLKNVAVLQIYDYNKKQFEQLNQNECIIEGGELVAFKNKVEKLRKQLAKQTKWIGDGSIGHGRSCKMRKVYEIGNKIKNFRDTYNHKISRYIVDFAIKHQCKYIKMEELTRHGFSDTLLGKWTYYDLQNKIIYKAQEAGIDVLFINPKFTSQKCSVCGHIDAENRKTRDNFKCLNCGFEENADINAARNIAISDDI